MSERVIPDDTPTGRTDHMSTTDWLDAVRADLAAATPGPWRTEWDGADKWHSITGAGHDLGGGLWVVCPAVATVEAGGDADARLIASAPDRLDQMERALRGVMEAHAPFRIYELDADGTPRCWNGVESVLATCCESCTPDDTIEAAGTGEWTEDMPYVPWPCPTVATIWEALSDEWV